MDIRIELLRAREPRAIQETLHQDGWKTADKGLGVLHATHPQAQHEREARARLGRIGLLLSRRVRIEFLPTPATS